MNKRLKDGRARYAQAQSGFLSYSAQCTWEEIKNEEKLPQVGEACSFFSLESGSMGLEAQISSRGSRSYVYRQEPHRVWKPAVLNDWMARGIKNSFNLGVGSRMLPCFFVLLLGK